MAQQQDLFSPEPGRSDPQSETLQRPTPRAGHTRPSSPWLERTELLVRVVVRLYLGLLIIALPWMRFWTENGLFTYIPGTEVLAGSGFVRGVVSGLGVLNVALAFQELFFPSRRS